MKDQFRKVLGLPALLAVAVGVVVAQSTLASVLEGSSIGGQGFIWAMIGAWLLCLCAVLSFAELALMLPRAGSISAYTEVAMGHWPAIVATLSGYVVVNLLAAPAELMLFGLVSNHVFFPSIPPLYLALILLTALTALNLIGVDLFAKFQEVFAVLMILTLVGLGIAGFLGLGQAGSLPQVNEPTNPLGLSVLTLTALAIWAFVGAEFVCSFAEETHHPAKNIPRAMTLGLTLTLAVYAIFFFGVMKRIPGSALEGQAIRHLFAAETLLGKAGLIWVGIAGLAATCSTINTLLGTISRMLYGMAHSGQIPRVFSKIHPKYQTPWVALFALSGGIAIPLFWAANSQDKLLSLLIAAALCWLLAYIIGHLDVLILRWQHPEWERPFRAPFFPLPQLAGIAGMLYIIANIYPDPQVKLQIYRNAGYLVAATGLYAFFWVKFRMKVPMFQPVPLSQALEE